MSDSLYHEIHNKMTEEYMEAFRVSWKEAFDKTAVMAYEAWRLQTEEQGEA